MSAYRLKFVAHFGFISNEEAGPIPRSPRRKEKRRDDDRRTIPPDRRVLRSNQWTVHDEYAAAALQGLIIEGAAFHPEDRLSCRRH